MVSVLSKESFRSIEARGAQPLDSDPGALLDLDMMRVIQDSGWKGPVGVIGEKSGDARVTLTNYLRGLDWLAAELKQLGSGGPRPFPLSP